MKQRPRKINWLNNQREVGRKKLVKVLEKLRRFHLIKKAKITEKNKLILKERRKILNQASDYNLLIKTLLLIFSAQFFAFDVW